MPNWKSTIKIGDLHKAYENGSMTIQEVGKGVSPFEFDTDELMEY